MQLLKSPSLAVAAPNAPMTELLSNPIFWIIVTAISEIIGMSKLKDNSIIELVIHTLMALKPKAK